MGHRNPDPPPSGDSSPSGPDPESRYVLTYEDAVGDEQRFDNWLMEWMLDWTAEPEVRRIDVDADSGDERIVIDIDSHDRVTPERHCGLLHELDGRVTGLTLRREPPTSTACPVGVEDDCTIEVHG
ncbi:hypothetical protein JCM18237_14090 [Halorubrum luteum]